MRHRQRLVFVHGFTQTARSWERIASAMPESFTVEAVDLPGHAGSNDAADIVESAGLLAVKGPAIFCGYSLGGRVCLRLAIDRPEIVRGLVLISATPGIESRPERALRKTADMRLADRIDSIGVEAFLDEWVEQPMFNGLKDSMLEDRRRNSAAGLAKSLRLSGQGSTEPMWDMLGRLEMPVTVVTGQLDAKYSAVAQRMATAMTATTADVIAIDGVGHSAHLENPAEFTRHLLDFLAKFQPG